MYRTPASPHATHRFGVYSILQGPLGSMFLVLESKFTWRTQALIEKFIICSVAWRMCFYFHNKGRTVATKSRKNVKFVNFAISVKNVTSAAWPLWGSCVRGDDFLLNIYVRRRLLNNSNRLLYASCKCILSGAQNWYLFYHPRGLWVFSPWLQGLQC